MSWGTKTIKKKPKPGAAPSDSKPSKQSLGLFRRARDTDLKNRTRPAIAVYGHPGTGKTHFFTTFPGVKFYIGTENGLFPILSEKQIEDEDLFVIELLEEGFDNREVMKRSKDGTISIDPIAVMDRFAEAIYEVKKYVVANPNQEVSVCIDDWGTLWDIAKKWRAEKFAAYVKEDDKREMMRLGIGIGLLGGWDDANSWATTSALVTDPLYYLKSLNVNLLLTAKMKVIETREGTEVIPDWYKKTERIADIVLRSLYDGAFKMTIVKARNKLKRSLIGKEIVNPTFEKLMKLVRE